MRPRAIGSKATTPTPESAARSSRNGGQVSHQRSQRLLTPADRWEADKAAVLERFRRDMDERYADEPESDSASLSAPGTPAAGVSSLPDEPTRQESPSRIDGGAGE